MRGINRIIGTVALATASLLPQDGRAQLFHRARGHSEPAPPTFTLGEVAAMIDELDRQLFALGMIDIKAPDVWGQNRMTRSRAEFEQEMKKELGGFQEILQAAQRRADLAVMTSATAISAAPGSVVGLSGVITSPPGGGRRARSGSTTTVVQPPPVVNTYLAGGLAAASELASLVPEATATAGAAASDPSGLLDSIGKRLDALEAGTLNMPGGVNQLATREGKAGVGLEPTIRLDQQARYLNHLDELRRVNSGDDRTDMAGYGLYLLRLPVSLLPGPASRKGKGAVVTMEARHELTPDLLEDTFRDVVIIDTTYALSRAINDNLHATICEAFLKKRGHKAAKPPTQETEEPQPMYMPEVDEYIGNLKEMITPSGIVPSTGPGPVMMEDLRLILGPVDWPGVPLKYPSGVPPKVPNPFVDGRLKEGLFNYFDRLQVLIAAIEGGQKDRPFHDATTMTLLRGSLTETYRYMRANAAINPMFQPAEVEKLAGMLFRRDLKGLIREREDFLKNLVVIRNNGDSSDWESQVTPTDVLAFVLLLHSAAVDRQLKEDMRIMAERRGCGCGDADHLWFYEFEPSPEAKQAFNAYVACKWPLHVYSLDPEVEQQNVLDAFSRRSELQLALAVSVASGTMNASNATKYARRLEFDLENVGLNRTAVGFGAGETTFGWRFYPRIQSPPTESNPRRIANLLAWNGPGPDWEVKNRQIEPGPRECIALLVVPNFIPALRLATVATWFDLAGHKARQQLGNQQMLELSHGLQVARNALAGVCDSKEYRTQDLTHLARRIQQLESQLPTQDYRVDLPDEGDLLGSEIFSSNAATLAPMLLAWYGEPVTEGEPSSIFLHGRGFSVSETQVVAGGVNIPDAQKRLISRNVMQIIIPRSARVIPVCCVDEADEGEDEVDEGTAGPADMADPSQKNAAKAAEAQPPVEVEPLPDPVGATRPRPARRPRKKSNAPNCARAVMDVHVATPNGISNHLFVEVTRTTDADSNRTVTTTATTTTTVAGNQTSTTTRLEVTPPGVALPSMTILPMGTPLLPNLSLSPAAVTAAPPGQIVPGLVPVKPEHEATEPTLNPVAVPIVPPAPAPKPATKRPATRTDETKKAGAGGATPKSGSPGSAARPMPIDPLALQGRTGRARGRSRPSNQGRPSTIDGDVSRTTRFAPPRLDAQARGGFIPAVNWAPAPTPGATPKQDATTTAPARPARKSLFDGWLQRNP